MEIIPSILVKPQEELKEKLEKIKPYADQIHIDIADGIFVPNTTLNDVGEYKEVVLGLTSSIHLMVQKPENHITKWLEFPADSYVAHLEATNRFDQVINEVKDQFKKIGVALNPDTPTDKIEDFIKTNEVDFVHFMTVKPGFYGGEFIPEVIKKIENFHYFYPDIPISVDGGIMPDNIKSLSDAGASTFVVGSYIWENENIEEALDKLKNSLN